jgi:hypothetical protein
MDFHKVEFEDDIDELGTDDLREIVEQFSQAQEQNIAEFEEAVDTVEEFEGFSQEVTDELVELSDLPEAEVESLSFSARRDLLDTLHESETTDEAEESEAEFEDTGTRGETHGEDGIDEAVTSAFSGISGVNLNDD